MAASGATLFSRLATSTPTTTNSFQAKQLGRQRKQAPSGAGGRIHSGLAKTLNVLDWTKLLAGLRRARVCQIHRRLGTHTKTSLAIPTSLQQQRHGPPNRPGQPARDYYGQVPLTGPTPTYRYDTKSVGGVNQSLSNVRVKHIYIDVTRKANGLIDGSTRGYCAAEQFVLSGRKIRLVPMMPTATATHSTSRGTLTNNRNGKIPTRPMFQMATIGKPGARMMPAFASFFAVGSAEGGTGVCFFHQFPALHHERPEVIFTHPDSTARLVGHHHQIAASN